MKRRILEKFLTILLFTLCCFIYKGSAQYCASSFTSVSYEHITKVSFVEINNITTGTTGGPVNYTSQIANVVQGAANTISVTIMADLDEYVYVFIDWNQNNVLNDAGEVYTVASGVSTAGPHTLSITTPLTATLGNTRMRVMLHYASSGPNPCVSATYGEAEDYTVNVLANCAAPLSPAVTGTTATTADIAWSNPATSIGTVIEYGPSGYLEGSGTQITATGTSYTITELIPNTEYEFYVRNICSATDTSSPVGPLSFTTPCQIPVLSSPVGDTICDVGEGSLSVSPSANAVVSWYEDVAVTTLVSTGATYTTPVLSSTSVYYAVGTVGNASVCQSDPVPVTALVRPLPTVAVSPAMDTVCLGTEVTFQATEDPDYSYTWSTGATSSAMTTAIPGGYTVTVTDEYGCVNTAPAYLDTFTNISIDGFDYIPFIYSDPLTYRFYPINPIATSTYFWDFGDGATSNEAEPIHTYPAFGNYSVKLIVSNDCASDSILLNINVEDANGTQDHLLPSSLSVFPNPSSRDLNIQLENGDRIQYLKVYNNIGQLILSEKKAPVHKYVLPVSNMAEGNYYLIIETEKGHRGIRQFTVL